MGDLLRQLNNFGDMIGWKDDHDRNDHGEQRWEITRGKHDHHRGGWKEGD
jgi:hypothetical protein